MDVNEDIDEKTYSLKDPVIYHNSSEFDAEELKVSQHIISTHIALIREITICYSYGNIVEPIMLSSGEEDHEAAVPPQQNLGGC